jgi:hypothetical protein
MYTFAIRDQEGAPFPRSTYAQFLWAELRNAPTGRGALGSSTPDARLPVLSEAEALVVAFLLDELDGACGNDALGTLARTLSDRLTSRLGN